MNKHKLGSNQYRRKPKHNPMKYLYWFFLFVLVVGTLGYLVKEQGKVDAMAQMPIESPVAPSLTPTPKVVVPSEKEKIVAYITRLWEKHGTDQVVKAINCFYSESGLRANAVGQNSDTPRSKDHGVAQLNDYWHSLTEAQKIDIYANLDEAHRIYVGRGNSFSAWYGKGCK